MLILHDFDLIKLDAGDAEVCQHIDAGKVEHYTAKGETDESPTDQVKFVEHKRHLEVDKYHGNLYNYRLLLKSHKSLSDYQ